ncbi:MAG: ferrochelatase [Sporolactobacillus sp.]
MEKTAVLLANLGTPEAPTPQAVRRYLAQFLSDRRVIDLPRWKWWPILHGIILRVRPKRSALLYKQVWTAAGSPLLRHCVAQRDALRARFNEENLRIELGMSYGEPSLAALLDDLHLWGVRRLLILPLYPQYSSTTVAPIWDSVAKAFAHWKDVPELTFIRDYAEHPLYINALSNRIADSFATCGRPDHLVLSYHGIPQSYADSGDDYAQRCGATTAALRDKLDVTTLACYQSKFGRDAWLTPATTDTLVQLAKQGARRIAVMAPAFTADCLETLQELDIENREAFCCAGGQQFHYIPALNDSPLFIDCLEAIVRERLLIR